MQVQASSAQLPDAFLQPVTHEQRSKPLGLRNNAVYVQASFAKAHFPSARQFDLPAAVFVDDVLQPGSHPATLLCKQGTGTRVGYYVQLQCNKKISKEFPSCRGSIALLPTDGSCQQPQAMHVYYSTSASTQQEANKQAAPGSGAGEGSSSKRASPSSEVPSTCVAAPYAELPTAAAPSAGISPTAASPTALPSNAYFPESLTPSAPSNAALPSAAAARAAAAALDAAEPAKQVCDKSPGKPLGSPQSPEKSTPQSDSHQPSSNEDDVAESSRPDCGIQAAVDASVAATDDQSRAMHALGPEEPQPSVKRQRLLTKSDQAPSPHAGAGSDDADATCDRLEEQQPIAQDTCGTVNLSEPVIPQLALQDAERPQSPASIAAAADMPAAGAVVDRTGCPPTSGGTASPKSAFAGYRVPSPSLIDGAGAAIALVTPLPTEAARRLASSFPADAAHNVILSVNACEVRDSAAVPELFSSSPSAGRLSLDMETAGQNADTPAAAAAAAVSSIIEAIAPSIMAEQSRPPPVSLPPLLSPPGQSSSVHRGLNAAGNDAGSVALDSSDASASAAVAASQPRMTGHGAASQSPTTCQPPPILPMAEEPNAVSAAVSQDYNAAFESSPEDRNAVSAAVGAPGDNSVDVDSNILAPPVSDVFPQQDASLQTKASDVPPHRVLSRQSAASDASPQRGASRQPSPNLLAAPTTGGRLGCSPFRPALNPEARDCSSGRRSGGSSGSDSPMGSPAGLPVIARSLSCELGSPTGCARASVAAVRLRGSLSSSCDREEAPWQSEADKLLSILLPQVR